MNDKKTAAPGAAEATALSAPAHYAGDDGAVAVAGGAKGLPAKRKLTAVQRLMHGESLEAVSRDLNVPVHRLSEWRNRVLMASESALKERERDDRDEEIARLHTEVGEITMANELLYAKIDTLEGGRPLARRRSRKEAGRIRSPREGLRNGTGL
ncbi:hypothetical protein [Palleronia abyssalis]|uniref:hypothetical protein n=1 Tax=Palleronia abyssalis TaxID=1501240 RepID=UPI000D55654E|nr:hypothetical protein [Palleronia abyssalis]